MVNNHSILCERWHNFTPLVISLNTVVRMMDPSILSIVGFGAVVVFGGMIMAAVTFFG